MANNDDWLKDLQYIDFLRDVGRHFTINRMLTMDSVKLRLEREQPLTFLEFNYMIMQGYDFVELNKRYGCTLQMGGSGSVGQHRAGRGARASHERGAIVRPDFAADYDFLGRQNGQDRERRRLAQPESPRRPTTIGSFGAIPRTAMWAGFCACSPTCRSGNHAAREAQGCRNQCRQGNSRHRSHASVPRRSQCRRSGRHRRARLWGRRRRGLAHFPVKDRRTGDDHRCRRSRSAWRAPKAKRADW